ncbi:hypothetical protein Tco_1478853 [Tanacetum coccineum]
MANLPPPNHAVDFLEDEPVHPQPAPIILHHLIEDDEEEEEVEEMDDDEVQVDDNDEDDVEAIHPYKEADPLNRPPPDSDNEIEYVTAVAPVNSSTL